MTEFLPLYLNVRTVVHPIMSFPRRRESRLFYLVMLNLFQHPL
ncbi:hypothetical protein [Rickettsia endosymbiont of Ceutorhynchus obstrictus]